MLVKVAIDLALDRLFTYEVTSALEKKLSVGQLLSVPFGHRFARGFAMALVDSDGEASALKLKPVAGIVDETPFFSPALLALVKSLSVYTAAPIESVLKAAVPAAVLKPGARAKERLYVEPVADAKTDALTVRQRWLYDQLVRLDGGWLQGLCRELKTTAASLRTLAESGAAVVAPRQMRRDPLVGRRLLPSKPLPLNAEQRDALSAIESADLSPVLLYGITGSGKTEVYLQAIASELAAGRGAIVLVPEISLTPQTVRRFASRFGGQVAVLHSALSDGERYDEWHRIRSGEARVVIGPRSAVFAPVRDLGLIVVDEEHDTSYKQDESPRYHARDAAVLRGRLEGARVVLGSATPSLESWMNVKRGKYRLASMRSRAGAGRLPAVCVVDMREEGNAGAIFSTRLLEAIGQRLDRGEQTILFLNRRGFSRTVNCERCGWTATCPDCSLAYTYHRADNCCRCHVCGGWIPVPAKCPECSSTTLTFKGIGTQRVEEALHRCFKRARVLRMDADSTGRKHSHDDILGAFRNGEADILVGTQMIAKGLDFPNVTLVGVLNADSSLNMPDFRASERTYQLLAQVSGRAGRAELPGEVFIQSHDPKVEAIVYASRNDYENFAASELKAREQCFFPPFCHLATINLRSRNVKAVADWSDMYAKSLMKVKSLKVSEAVPSALEKADGWFRWQIVVRAANASAITKAFKWICSERPTPESVKVYLDIDAVSMF